MVSLDELYSQIYAYAQEAYPFVEPYVNEAYAYLYAIAGQYGTGVEYLIGAIALAVFLFLVLALWLWMRRRRAQEVLKLITTRGISVTTNEIIVKTEGKPEFVEKTTLSFPKSDKVQIEMGMDKMMVSLLEKIARPRVTEKGIEVPAVKPAEAKPAEAVIERKIPAPAPPAAPAVAEAIEKARSVSSAIKSITKKYSLDSLTMINASGLLIGSSCKTPDADAALATSLLSELDMVDRISRVKIEGREMKYLFSIPYKDTHIISLLKTAREIDAAALVALENDLKISTGLI